MVLNLNGMFYASVVVSCTRCKNHLILKKIPGIGVYAVVRGTFRVHQSLNCVIMETIANSKVAYGLSGIKDVCYHMQSQRQNRLNVLSRVRTTNCLFKQTL